MNAVLQQTDDDIRPFHVNFPEANLAELRQRLTRTRLPEKETVTDASQGVQLATIEQLVRYWARITTGASASRS